MSVDIKRRVQERLASQAPALLDSPSRFERRVRVREAVAKILTEEGVAMAPREIAALVYSIADAIVGLGPLEKLLRDESVTEVMVVAPSKIFVERNGSIERCDVELQDERAVRHLIERIVAPLGVRVDEAMPWVDARLPDGSRVHAIIPPLAINGASLTIRKFASTPLTATDLIDIGTWSSATCEMLAESVRSRKNLIVCGGTGAGKTTLLNVLSSFVLPTERIITIEDAAELQLGQEHVVSLETRAANVEGAGAVTVRDLVRNALRMRPDRIIVGEVRGGEALDMLQAMNTGHEGSMSTAHANSASDLIERLEAMVLMSGATLPIEAVRRQIAAGVDLIVAVERGRDGVRRVTEVMQVMPDLSLEPRA
ncbi:MAG: CpaF family protein [Actinomycetota bacterium]